MTYCESLGHERIPATYVGTLHDGDERFPSVKYCTECATVMISSGQYEPIKVELEYNRDVLVDVLIYYQATNTSGCICGWGVLGASHAEHVADVYEQSVRA